MPLNASDYFGAHHQVDLDTVRRNDLFTERCADMFLEFRVMHPHEDGYRWHVRFERYLNRVPGNKAPGSMETRYEKEIIRAKRAA